MNFPNIINPRKCSRCKKTQGLTNFGFNSRTGGRLKTCVRCRMIQENRDNRRKDLELKPEIEEAVIMGLPKHLMLPVDVVISAGVKYYHAEPDSIPPPYIFSYDYSY